MLQLSTFYCTCTYRVQQKSGPLKFFAVFSATVLNFNLKFYRFIYLKPSISNCQVKCDSVEKRRSYRLFNMIAYQFFSIQKCSGYNSNLITSLKQHSWIMIRCQNSIVTANVRSVHHQLQATTPASSRLIWEIFYSLVDRSLWQVAPDNLKRFPEFGACFRLWFKLAVSLQHCTPLGPLKSIGFIFKVWWYLDSWPAASSVHCTAWRCTLCVLTRRPAGRWIQWAAGDCFKGTII